MEVLRFTCVEEIANSPRYTREPLHSLATLKISQVSIYKTSINASLINMYGLVHRQTNGKNRKREWNGKIYFCQSSINLFLGIWSVWLLSAHAAEAVPFCWQKVTKNHVRWVCFAKNRLHFAKSQKLALCTGCVKNANPTTASNRLTFYAPFHRFS